MITWVLFIFVGYPGPYYTPSIIEGFTSYDVCEITGERIITTIKDSSFKCVKVEK